MQHIMSVYCNKYAYIYVLADDSKSCLRNHWLTDRHKYISVISVSSTTTELKKTKQNNKLHLLLMISIPADVNIIH